jgi:hypothetical protein
MILSSAFLHDDKHSDKVSRERRTLHYCTAEPPATSPKFNLQTLKCQRTRRMSATHNLDYHTYVGIQTKRRRATTEPSLSFLKDQSFANQTRAPKGAITRIGASDNPKRLWCGARTSKERFDSTPFRVVAIECLLPKVGLSESANLGLSDSIPSELADMPLLLPSQTSLRLRNPRAIRVDNYSAI